MKQQQIRNAYQIVEEMRNNGERYPLRVSDALFRVKKALQSQWEFQQEEVQKIYELYKPEQEGMQLHFETPEKAEEFTKAVDELANLEVELDYVKPRINISLAETAGFTLAEREALDEFIEFIDE